ncbi:unnamed protein product, partial [Adineta steineri]
LSPTMEQQALNTLAKESLKNLSKFGGGDHEDVVKWLSDVEEVFTRTQLQSSNRYIAVQSYLTDSAEKWFRANKSTILDWSSFKIELVKAYKPSLHQLLLKMEQRIQLSNECVMDYYCDKIYLCSQVYPDMSFSMIIHYLTKGLKPSLIAHVIRRNPTTPNAFRICVQDEEKILLTLNGFSYTTPTEHYNYPTDNIDMDHQVNIIKRPINAHNQSFNRQHYQSAPQPLMNVPTTASSSSFSRSADPYRSSDSYRSSSSTSRQCYACHGFGHIAPYCPHRKNM